MCAKIRIARNTVFAFAICLLIAGPTVELTLAADDAPVAKAMQLMDEALKLSNAGEFDKAAGKLDEVMALNPNPQLAMMMRMRVGTDELIAMLSRAQLADKAYAILDLSLKGMQQVAADPKTTVALIQKLINQDIKERMRAEKDLVAVGEYAVPGLLMALDAEQEAAFGWTREERETARAYARMALDEMGERAVMPLIEALRTDSIGVKMQVCEILGKSGDWRAIPGLKALTEDKSQPARVKEAAASALALLCPDAGLPAEWTAADSYCSLAESYYYIDRRIIDYVPGLERTIWTWRPAGQDYIARMTFAVAPQYAYSELMAAKLIRDGLGVGSDDAKLQAALASWGRMSLDDTRRQMLALLVADSYSLLIEARAVAAGATTPTGAAIPPEARDEAGARVGELEAARTLNRLIGSPCLHDALRRFVSDGDHAQAMECVADIRALADSSIPERENGLIEGLSAPSPALRCACAEALMATSPDGKMGGERQAVAAVIGACSIGAMSNVLVITDDPALYAKISAALARAACNNEKLTTVGEALLRVETAMPAVSLIMIDARAVGSVDDAVEALRKDIVARFIPIVLLASANDVRGMTGLGDRGAYPVASDTPPDTIAQAVAKTIELTMMPEKPGPAAYERLARLLVAVDGLSAETRYPITGSAPTIAGLLNGKTPDSVRLPALGALERIAWPVALNPIMAVFLDQAAPIELRLAAGKAATSTLLGGGGKHVARLDEAQRKAVLDIANNPDATPEMRAVAVRLFSVAPPEGTGKTGR